MDDQIPRTQFEEGLDGSNFVGAAWLSASARAQHALELVVPHKQQVERRQAKAASDRTDLEFHGIQPHLVGPGFP